MSEDTKVSLRSFVDTRWSHCLRHLDQTMRYPHKIYCVLCNQLTTQILSVRKAGSTFQKYCVSVILSLQKGDKENLCAEEHLQLEIPYNPLHRAPDKKE